VHWNPAKYKSVTGKQTLKTCVPKFGNGRTFTDKQVVHCYIAGKSNVPTVVGDFVSFDFEMRNGDDGWYIWKILQLYRTTADRKIYAVLQWHRPGYSKRLIECAKNQKVQLYQGMCGLGMLL